MPMKSVALAMAMVEHTMCLCVSKLLLKSLSSLDSLQFDLISTSHMALVSHV